MTCSKLQALKPRWQACHSEQEYLSNVEACLEALRAGDSYELCLTTTLYRQQPPCPRALYRMLRQTNPAPMAAFLELGGARPLTVSISCCLRVLCRTSDSCAACCPAEATDTLKGHDSDSWSDLLLCMQRLGQLLTGMLGQLQHRSYGGSAAIEPRTTLGCFCT